MSNSWSLSAVTLAGLLAFTPGCGGGEEAGGPEVSADGELVAVTVSGIVTAASGEARPAEDAPDRKGQLTFRVFHVDRLVNTKVRISVSPADGGRASAAVAGDEAADLSPGMYNARIRYEEEGVGTFEGELEDLAVLRGFETVYRVDLAAPVGLFDASFTNDGERVNSDVRVSLFNAGADPDTSDAIVQNRSAAESFPVAAGTYDLYARYAAGENLTDEVERLGIEVPGSMGRYDEEIGFELNIVGVRFDVVNFGEEVNGDSRVYFFAPGANVDQAVALFQSDAGENAAVAPGTYDVRVVYSPSPQRETWGDQVIEDFVVEEGSLRAERVSLENALAVLRLEVQSEDRELTDFTRLRAYNVGADREAASPLFDVEGGGPHVVPAGSYDLWVTYTGEAGSLDRRFDSVELVHNDTWSQSLEL